MKKTVAVSIISIYLCAIAVVSLLGAAIVNYNPTVYVRQIDCLNEEATVEVNQQTGIEEAVIYIKYSAGVKLQLKWKIIPDSATNKTVSFPHEPNERYTISSEGLVTIYKKQGIIVKILAMDGSNVYRIINILPY